MEHIRLPAYDDNGVCRFHETLEAESLAGARYRLLHSPAYAEGMAADDVIELDERVRLGCRVVQRGGNLSVIVAFASEALKQVHRDRIARDITSIEGRVDGGPGAVLVCTVPVRGGFPRVDHFFDDLCASLQDTTWWYGNVYEPGTTIPLNWW